MKNKSIKNLSSIFIFVFFALVSVNIASAQNDRRDRRDGNQKQTQNNQSKHQDQYDQQKTQNQQRFEQRQQSYQQFHQQRVQQQPQQSVVNNQNRIRVEPTNRITTTPNNNNQRRDDNRNRQSQYAQRQLNDHERQQIIKQTTNWDRSEHNWQTAYNSGWQQNQNLFDRQSRLLQQQNRLNHYAFQQSYWERVREDRDRLNNWQFYNDVALDYSYLRGGQTYYTSQYGVNLLTDAVNDGYQEGFLAGQADREDRYRYDFRDAFAFQDASYGYNGYWVALSEYQNYFRQGFQNGYDDGFYNRYRYGAYTNGNYAVSASVLGGLLNFSFIGR